MNTRDLSHLIIEKLMNARCRVLSIDGELCAGKTTLVDLLMNEITKRGLNCIKFSTDMFLADRDKRKYADNPAMLDLRNWFNESEGLPILERLLNVSDNQEIRFLAYDRATGTRSMEVMVKTTPDSIILLEGIFMTEWIQKSGPTEKLVKVYLQADQEVCFDRMKKRNTYIPLERLTFESSHIYFPAIKKYRKYLSDEAIGFDVVANTNDFENIFVTKGVIHK